MTKRSLTPPRMALDRSYMQGCRMTKLIKKQAGFSLIEVLVATLILSFAILGVIGLQMIGMKGTHQSSMKQQAMASVHSMLERMRSNRVGVLARSYEVDSNNLNCQTMTLPNCRLSNCSSLQIVNRDVLNVMCGKQVGGGFFTNGIKTTNANGNEILTGGRMVIQCAPADVANGILANCASGDVKIKVTWTEREFGQETNTASDSIEIQTRI